MNQHWTDDQIISQGAEWYWSGEVTSAYFLAKRLRCCAKRARNLWDRIEKRASQRALEYIPRPNHENTTKEWMR